MKTLTGALIVAVTGVKRDTKGTNIGNKVQVIEQELAPQDQISVNISRSNVNYMEKGSLGKELR